MKNLILVFSILISTRIWPATQEAFLKRIQAHFVVMDYASACEEAQQAIYALPKDPELYAAYIKALAHAGNDKVLWETWNQYKSLYPELALNNQEVQEMMAWGAIWKAASSPLPMIRLGSLLGAFFGNDAKSTPVLKKFCRDGSSLIRSAAVQLISHMRDAQLCDEVYAMLFQEKNWKVRLEVIKAIGKMKIKGGQPELLKIIADEYSTAIEKSAAIEALLVLLENIDREKILALTNSDRAGLRLLACQVVCHLKSDRDADLMVILSTDNHAEVRMAALYALGLLSIPSMKNSLVNLARAKLQDPTPEVAVTAAWLLTILQPASAREAFMPMITHPQRQIRLLAAAALTSTGRYGSSLALELFAKSQDPFFKMNLAIGMICQQTEVLAACHALQQGLTTETGRWMWQEKGAFRLLAPSVVRQDEEIPNAPEAINQLTRLEILNMLAIAKSPDAENAIRSFLQQRQWNISGLATALLLMEGDETSLELVQALLSDPDPRIQMQAALTLSLWGSKEEAIATLEKGYNGADRETKEKILEGLGKIGSRTSIPFLLDRLQEPQQMLRLIAASSLLQCLYH